jgi:hypothetical protein
MILKFIQINFKVFNKNHIFIIKYIIKIGKKLNKYFIKIKLI